VLALGFVGWRPFMTNLIEHHSLVYPPTDELGYKVGTGNQVPSELVGTTRLDKLASLFFARTDVAGVSVKWKVPGIFDPHELSMDSVTRIGGFGPWFGAAAVCGGVALLGAVAVALRWRLAPSYRDLEIPAVLLFLAVLSTVLFPERWWVRAPVHGDRPFRLMATTISDR